MLFSRLFAPLCLVVLFSGSSVTWSSSINSMLPSRTILPTAVGLGPNLAESIATGAQLAMNTCKHFFKWDRWNCPDSAFSKKNILPITRENAFASAILSAGIVHSITKNCSRGDMENCGCAPIGRSFASLDSSSQPKNENKDVEWMWGGCSEDTKYAEQVAKNFLNSFEIGGDVHSYVNMHNNMVGRTLARSMMVRHCRCHGMSGSCSVQTCWLQLAPFPEIAKRLRAHYENAYKIEMNNARETREATNVERPETLVYLDDSPNYCKADYQTGWMGTKGRICSRNQTAEDVAEKRSCKRLCKSCGLRVRKKEKKISLRCNCKFHWCCEVTCSTCTKTVNEFFCD